MTTLTRNLKNLTIAGVSPVLKYYPSRGIGPIDTTWNVSDLYFPELGVAVFSHRTSLPGASVSLNWTGTALYLYGAANRGSYTIDLDGIQTEGTPTSPKLLFAQADLTQRSHSLKLYVSGGSIIDVWGMIITVEMGETGTVIEDDTLMTATTSNTSPLLPKGTVFTGTWYDEELVGIATNVTGSAVSIPITNAWAFGIRGDVDIDHGPYSVTLSSNIDSNHTVHYNGSSPFPTPYVLMYLATGLDITRLYHVEITNEANLHYNQRYIVVYGPPSPPPSPKLSKSTIAGIAIGSIILFLILIYIYRKRRNRTIITSQPDSPTSDVQLDGADYPTTELQSTTLINHLPHPGSIISHSSARNVPLSSPPNPSPHAHGLSNEDARFFNNLYSSLDVPVHTEQKIEQDGRA